MSQTSGVRGQKSAECRQKQKAENTAEIIENLRMIKRDGIDGLIEWLVSSGYFESPASTKYHGCYPGGLARHSINVFDNLIVFSVVLAGSLPIDSIKIASYLHDVCKVGAYIGDSAKYEWNKAQPKGHAELSITRIEQFIKLTDLERSMIRYHMGVYAHTADDLKKAWEEHPAIKLMYFADELAAMQEKTEEAL